MTAKNEKYFNETDILHFKQYAEATTSWQREQIYNQHLHKFIDKQISTAIKLMNIGGSKHIMNNYEDIKQDLHLHIYTYTLPKIDVTRIQAIQNLIYISAKNKLINILTSLDSKKQIKYDYNDYNLDEQELIEEEVLSTDDITKLIDARIIELKHQQKTVNCVAYTYLEWLHRYIIEHDYNAEGFKEFVMKKMNIGNSQFLNISHKFGFKTIAFKSKKTEK